MDTGCLKMNWFTATVVTRPLAMRTGSTEPARSTCAMIQPPKMSPLKLASDGIGITRSTSSLSDGKEAGACEVACISAWVIGGVFRQRGSASIVLEGVYPV